MSDYIIDPEIVRKNAYLPVELAKLSYGNPEAALELLRAWGEGQKPITKLWDEAINLSNETKNFKEAK
jgi:hypothetical protein